MVEISDFEPADIEDLVLQTQQLAEMAMVDWRGMVRAAATVGPAWTGRLDGRVIGCAGVSLSWRGRAHAWCVLSDGIPRCAWVGIHRAVADRLERLAELGVWRLEAETALGFRPGIRWLTLLGFEREGTARGFGPGGEDFVRFARVTL